MIILLSFELQPPIGNVKDPSLSIWFNNQYFFDSEGEAISWIKKTYRETIAEEKRAADSGNPLCGGITGRIMFYRMSVTTKSNMIDIGKNRYFLNNGEELPCKWVDYEKALLRKNGWKSINYHGPL